MKLKCPKCGYLWESESEMLWVCCPNCMRKSVREAMIVVDKQ